MADIKIAGIPETISRNDYTRLAASVGIDVRHLRSMEWAADGIYAEVFALDANGRRVYTAGDVATHRVFIRVTDNG